MRLKLTRRWPTTGWMVRNNWDRIGGCTRLVVSVVTTLAALVWSGAAAAEAGAHAVMVVPFESSRLTSEDQWMGEGAAQIISLGLRQHPAFIQIERARLKAVIDAAAPSEELLTEVARDVQADAVLYGRISQTDGRLVIEPFILNLERGKATKTLLPPIAMTLTDFARRAATLPAIYARTLNVTLTADESARIERAARPTDSRQALELFVRAQLEFLTQL